MQVGDPTILTPVVNPAEIPAVRPPVRPASDARAPDKRQSAREERSAEFRAALEAASGTASDIFGEPLSADGRIVVQEARPEKFPTGEFELSSSESDDLYSAMRGAMQDEDTGQKSPALTRQFQSATQQYARNFFSVGGTFAGRGESLEITA